MDKERNEQIHEKGFNMYNYITSDLDGEYKRIKVGVAQLDDAVLNIGTIHEALPNHQFANKKYIIKALSENNVEELRAISNLYYNINGIQEGVCNYLAF